MTVQPSDLDLLLAEVREGRPASWGEWLDRLAGVTIGGAATSADLFAVRECDTLIVLFRDETGEGRRIFQLDFVSLETVRHLFGRIDDRVGKVRAGEPAGDTTQVWPEDSSFAPWC